MTERIEWEEPEELTRERREMNRRLAAFAVRAWLGLGTPAMLLALRVSATSTVEVAGFLFALVHFPAVLWIGQLMSRRSTAAPKFVLDLNGARGPLDSAEFPWKLARSFEIADHPTAPGIRRLSIELRTGRRSLLDFRAGQLDEAELASFVQTCIAPHIEKRLLKRARRVL